MIWLIIPFGILTPNASTSGIDKFFWPVGACFKNGNDQHSYQSRICDGGGPNRNSLLAVRRNPEKYSLGIPRNPSAKTACPIRNDSALVRLSSLISSPFLPMDIVRTTNDPSFVILSLLVSITLQNPISLTTVNDMHHARHRGSSPKWPLEIPL